MIDHRIAVTSVGFKIFCTLLDGRGACFVHRHVGFKRVCVEETQLLCTGMWVLSDLVHWGSILVRRHVGFKRFYGLGAHLLCTGMWVLRG